jgi:hypothetical protein
LVTYTSFFSIATSMTFRWHNVGWIGGWEGTEGEGRGPPYSEPAADGDAAADDVVDDTKAQCPRCPLIGEFLLIEPKTKPNSIHLTVFDVFMFLTSSCMYM